MIITLLSNDYIYILTKQCYNSFKKKRQTMSNKISPEIHKRLEAAVLDIFSNSDFHKANIRDVAKKAGVSFSTIYSYYGSKEGLLFAFVDIWLGKLTERIIDHLHGIEDLKEKLRKVFWIQLDYYEKNPGLGKILFMTVPMQTWMADNTFLQKKMFNVFMDVLQQGQKQGILNPKVCVGMLLDVMHGLVQCFFYVDLQGSERESCRKCKSSF